MASKRDSEGERESLQRASEGARERESARARGRARESARERDRETERARERAREKRRSGGWEGGMERTSAREGERERETRKRPASLGNQLQGLTLNRQGHRGGKLHCCLRSQRLPNSAAAAGFSTNSSSSPSPPLPTIPIFSSCQPTATSHHVAPFPSASTMVKAIRRACLPAFAPPLALAPALRDGDVGGLA